MKRKRYKPDPKSVVGYIRVSTDAQAEEGVSLEAQEAAITAYCRLKSLCLVEVVVDAAVSASSKVLTEREGGHRVSEMVDSGTIGGVVALKLDRLFRNVVDCLVTVEGWRRKGAACHLIDLGGQSIDTSSAMGKMFLTMAAGFAELEANLISERTKAALERKKLRGERVGTVMYGYRPSGDGRTLVKDAQEQAVLRRVRKMRCQGRTLQNIVDTLNQEGVPARGERWHLATIHRLLHRGAA